MLVKDLLILFQACNEGVINVLEHYFEMSKFDAQDALSIYKHFCKQTERVVEYLGVAKKLQNLLNVPIPNLRHVRALRAARERKSENVVDFLVVVVFVRRGVHDAVLGGVALKHLVDVFIDLDFLARPRRLDFGRRGPASCDQLLW